MRIAAFILLILWPGFAMAQGAATLVADSVTLNDRNQLIADGNVTVFYDGTTLRATRIIYDEPADQLTITGPIVIQTADGTQLNADSATLDPTLENGILIGARLVLDQKLQLVANQIDQKDGRYSQLYKTAVTSCRVCGDQAPLWDIRAERVVRDNIEQQLYFDNATLRVRGVPVFWLPRMRLPDPALKRSTGFLVPRQRNTNRLGSGIKIPYFITLGDYRDVTVTPYVSAETTTLELRYRQGFARGRLEINGAVSDDTLAAERRSYLFADATFMLPRGYRLAFDIESVTDTAYLSDYDYSSRDRLDSAIAITKVTDNTLRATNLTYYETLRDDESNASLPQIVAEGIFETRAEPRFGGTLILGADVDTAYRDSNDQGDSGRDVTRAGAHGEWQFDRIFENGLRANIAIGAQADIYHIVDDPAYDAVAARFVPGTSLMLRYPLARTSTSGTAHLLEPVISLGWANAYGTSPPNEDSTRSELDRANLFTTQRFVGEDAVATGAEAAIGLSWTRFGTAGTTSALTFGRIYRDIAQAEFTPSSGLDGVVSDWLVAGQITIPDGFILGANALVDASTGVTRADSRIGWRNDTVDLSAAYIWQASDAAENRNQTVSEWTLDADLVLSRAWSVNLDARYDIAADRPVRGGVGFQWRNECVKIDVSASRRFSSSSNVAPTTTFGLSGSLSGFSAGRSLGGPAAACRNE